MSFNNRKEDINAILDLKDGESYMFNEHCEGGVEVKKVEGSYELYELGYYCGTPTFDRNFDSKDVAEIVDTVYRYYS